MEHPDYAPDKRTLTEGVGNGNDQRIPSVGLSRKEVAPRLFPSVSALLESMECPEVEQAWGEMFPSWSDFEYLQTLWRERGRPVIEWPLEGWVWEKILGSLEQSSPELKGDLQ